MCNYRIYGDEFLKYDTLSKKIILDSLCSYGVAGDLNNVLDIPAPGGYYCPNKFGLYDVCGNIAEMVKEKGISKGGSWRNTGGDVKIKSRGHYNKSSIDLGFRYFMQVIEK